MAKDYVFMKITRDDLHLPLIVADSCRELAYLSGEPYKRVSEYISNSIKSGTPYPKYIRIQIDEEQEDEC